MEIEKSFRLSLKVHGSLVLVAALFHGIWHWFFPGYAELNGLTEIQWNVLFMLNWAVALCLLLFSIFSFGVSIIRSFTLDQLRMFSALMIGFWACRFVLELIFPVRVPFIIVPNPSFLFKVLIFVGIGILALPEMQFWLLRLQKK